MRTVFMDATASIACGIGGMRPWFMGRNRVESMRHRWDATGVHGRNRVHLDATVSMDATGRWMRPACRWMQPASMDASSFDGCNLELDALC